MTFNMERIIDIIELGVPKLSKRVKYPCGICNKCVKNSQKAVLCDSCGFWTHIGCNGTTHEEYEFLQSSEDIWNCVVCDVRENRASIPFTICNTEELINMNHL